MNKPVIPFDILEGSIAHIEQLKSQAEKMLGPKHPIADAVISMDFAGHSYDYSELLVMRDGVLDLAVMNATATTARPWESPETVLNDLRVAHERMEQLEKERIDLIKEHCSQYAQDLFTTIHNLDDATPLPRPFLCDEYLEKRDITPVWAEKIWPELVRKPECVAVIKDV